MTSQETKKVILLTEKPFNRETNTQIVDLILQAGYEIITLIGEQNIHYVDQALAQANALIVRSDKVNAELINKARDLQIIVRAGSGYNDIDISACTARHIVVETTPGQNANAVAELSFALLLQHARNYFDGTVGYELRGKTLGIVGYGHIGQIIAKIAIGFGMDVHVYDPCINFPFISLLNNDVKPEEDIRDLFQKCQHISLNLPLNEKTKKIIGYDLMMHMPENAVLINTARGGVIDSQGLKDALSNRKDFTYISDVELDCRYWVENFYEKPKVFFTPVKQGAQTAEANYNAGVAAANQIVEFFQTGVAKLRIN